MRTALIVGASAATAAAAGVAGFKLYKDTYGAPVDEQVALVLKGNERLFSSKELALIKDLLARGQGHLFAAWPVPGTQDALKRKLVAQLTSLNATYHGGICAYVDNAKKLLQDSKESRNPFDGYTPSVPHGEKLDFATPDFLALEQEGLVQAASTAFVLVAGGLGERLGYSGIKVALPCESASGWSFLELYARFIKALQVASGTTKKLPFAIMTSDDTHARTLHHLEAHRYFGLDKGQVHLIKQEKVACLIDNDASLALDPADSYTLQTKPHGHGDVHALLHSSGLAKKWHSHGFKWVAFFQDTNAQVFRALTAALGVSARHDYDMNSLAVPRKAKEAIGAIACLKHTDGSTLTINVEYNQLDPLLRGTVSPQGDVNDETGWSPYPGNINQLIIKLDSYVQQLQRTGGIISEFVNPKYKDASKTAFKSSTRLECMMQDYPKALPSDAKVGFTTVNQVWASYSPVKNNAADAQAKAKEGGPTHSATTGEVDLYRVNCYILEQLAGARMPEPEPATFNGISVNMTPRVVLAPEWAPTLEAVGSKVSKDSIKLSKGAVLLLDGQNIRVEGPVEVQGALVIRAVPGANVRVGALNVANAGWTWQPLKEGEEAKEEEKIRGFRVLKTETAEYSFDKAGDYTVGLLPQAVGTPLAPRSTPAEPLTPMMSMQPLGSTTSPAKSSSGPSAAPAAPASTPAAPAAPEAAAPSAPALPPAAPAASAQAAPAAAAPPAPVARVAAPAPVATSGTPAAPGTPTAEEEAAGPLAPAPTPAAPAASAAEATPVRAPATPTATLSAAAAVFTPSSASAAAPTTVTPPASEADLAGGEEEEEEGEDDPTVTPPGGSAGAAGSTSATKKKKKKSGKRK